MFRAVFTYLLAFAGTFLLLQYALGDAQGFLSGYIAQSLIAGYLTPAASWLFNRTVAPLVLLTTDITTFPLPTALTTFLEGSSSTHIPATAFPPGYFSTPGAEPSAFFSSLTGTVSGLSRYPLALVSLLLEKVADFFYDFAHPAYSTLLVLSVLIILLALVVSCRDSIKRFSVRDRPRRKRKMPKPTSSVSPSAPPSKDQIAPTAPSEPASLQESLTGQQAQPQEQQPERPQDAPQDDEPRRQSPSSLRPSDPGPSTGRSRWRPAPGPRPPPERILKFRRALEELEKTRPQARPQGSPPGPVIEPAQRRNTPSASASPSASSSSSSRPSSPSHPPPPPPPAPLAFPAPSRPSRPQGAPTAPQRLTTADTPQPAAENPRRRPAQNAPRRPAPPLPQGPEEREPIMPALPPPGLTIMPARIRDGAVVPPAQQDGQEPIESPGSSPGLEPPNSLPPTLEHPPLATSGASLPPVRQEGDRAPETSRGSAMKAEEVAPRGSQGLAQTQTAPTALKKGKSPEATRQEARGPKAPRAPEREEKAPVGPKEVLPPMAPEKVTEEPPSAREEVASPPATPKRQGEPVSSPVTAVKKPAAALGAVPGNVAPSVPTPAPAATGTEAGDQGDEEMDVDPREEAQLPPIPDGNTIGGPRQDVDFGNLGGNTTVEAHRFADDVDMVDDQSADEPQDTEMGKSNDTVDPNANQPHFSSNSGVGYDPSVFQSTVQEQGPSAWTAPVTSGNIGQASGQDPPAQGAPTGVAPDGDGGDVSMSDSQIQPPPPANETPTQSQQADGPVAEATSGQLGAGERDTSGEADSEAPGGPGGFSSLESSPESEGYAPPANQPKGSTMDERDDIQDVSVSMPVPSGPNYGTVPGYVPDARNPAYVPAPTNFVPWIPPKPPGGPAASTSSVGAKKGASSFFLPKPPGGSGPNASSAEADKFAALISRGMTHDADSSDDEDPDDEDESSTAPPASAPPAPAPPGPAPPAPAPQPTALPPGQASGMQQPLAPIFSFDQTNVSQQPQPPIFTSSHTGRNTTGYFQPPGSIDFNFKPDPANDDSFAKGRIPKPHVSKQQANISASAPPVAPQAQGSRHIKVPTSRKNRQGGDAQESAEGPSMPQTPQNDQPDNELMGNNASTTASGQQAPDTSRIDPALTANEGSASAPAQQDTTRDESNIDLQAPASHTDASSQAPPALPPTHAAASTQAPAPPSQPRQQGPYYTGMDSINPLDRADQGNDAASALPVKEVQYNADGRQIKIPVRRNRRGAGAQGSAEAPTGQRERSPIDYEIMGLYEDDSAPASGQQGAAFDESVIDPELEQWENQLLADPE